MKDGQSIKYKTKGGVTHTITKRGNNYCFGFDCESSLDRAKKTLEWIDNPSRTA